MLLWIQLGGSGHDMVMGSAVSPVDGDTYVIGTMKYSEVRWLPLSPAVPPQPNPRRGEGGRRASHSLETHFSFLLPKTKHGATPHTLRPAHVRRHDHRR